MPVPRPVVAGTRRIGASCVRGSWHSIRGRWQGMCCTWCDGSDAVCASASRAYSYLIRARRTTDLRRTQCARSRSARVPGVVARWTVSERSATRRRTDVLDDELGRFPVQQGRLVVGLCGWLGHVVTTWRLVVHRLRFAPRCASHPRGESPADAPNAEHITVTQAAIRTSVLTRRSRTNAVSGTGGGRGRRRCTRRRSVPRHAPAGRDPS